MQSGACACVLFDLGGVRSNGNRVTYTASRSVPPMLEASRPFAHAGFLAPELVEVNHAVFVR
jgi:hypothetical protein